MKWLTEAQTLEAAHEGRSISRFGDGELKLATGRDCVSQQFDPNLQQRLRAILRAPGAGPLVCIPLDNPHSPKAPLWRTFRAAKYTSLYDDRGTYGSPFITRPDSSPWIDTPVYWSKVVDLWRGLDVVLVRGSEKSLRASDMPEAASVSEIIGPRQHAFAQADSLYRMLNGERRRVILCLGPTATVLAYYLGIEGVHALDLGHVGMFMRRNRKLCGCSGPTCASEAGKICRQSGESI